VKVLLDLNLSPRWLPILAAAGHEVSHWSAIGPLDAPDAEIMAYAEAGGFVVLTQDLDFGTILAASGSRGPSVIQIRSDDIRPESIGTAVIGALSQLSDELTDGALVTVEPMRTRLRVLPLRPKG
jgi:predicted nuclease of predicted toxin-antitoxin system